MRFCFTIAITAGRFHCETASLPCRQRGRFKSTYRVKKEPTRITATKAVRIPNTLTGTLQTGFPAHTGYTWFLVTS